MIIDHQANKITFTEPKTFKNKKDTVKVDTKNHWFLLNKDVVLYANPVEFQVTQGGFQLTYEDSMGNEYTATPEGTGLEYLEVNDTHDHKQAVSILVGECLSLLADPDSKSTSECNCRELQAQITTLTDENETLSGQIETLTTEKGTLEGQVETLTGQVETLTGQLEEAQSQTSSTGVQDYQKFTLNNTEYNIRILGNDTSRVFFMFYTDDTPVTLSLSTLGFSSQQGAALFKNTTDNTSIQFELYIDGTLQSNAGGINTNDYCYYLTTNPAVAFTADKPVCVKITIKDSNDEVVSTAYDQFTYTPNGGGGVVDNRDTTTMQLIQSNLNGYIEIKCMVQNSTHRPISGTIVLYAGNTYLDTVTLDENNYVDYTPELESGTYTFTGYYYGSNEYKPCTNTLSNVEIT